MLNSVAIAINGVTVPSFFVLCGTSSSARSSLKLCGIPQCVQVVCYIGHFVGGFEFSMLFHIV